MRGDADAGQQVVQLQAAPQLTVGCDPYHWSQVTSQAPLPQFTVAAWLQLDSPSHRTVHAASAPQSAVKPQQALTPQSMVHA